MSQRSSLRSQPDVSDGLQWAISPPSRCSSLWRRILCQSIFVRVAIRLGDGFVASLLAHPGGTVTGRSPPRDQYGPIGGKWLEVLKETAPRLTRVMMIYHPETPNPSKPSERLSFAEAAPRFGVEGLADLAGASVSRYAGDDLKVS